MKGALCNLFALEKKPQLFLCKRVHGRDPEVQAAARAMDVAAFQVDFAPAAIPQPLLVRVLYPPSTGDQPYAYVLAGQTLQKQYGRL
jgi:hypothetical protein